MVTQALGKAYNGQYASLNKLIPGISAAKDPMAQLQQQFGGMAEAAANNDPFAKMKIIFDDLAETVGAVLIPAMTTLLTALQPLIDTLAPISTELVEKLAPVLTAIIEPLGGFLSKLMEDLAPIIDVIMELVGILMELLAPILDIVSEVISQLSVAIMALLEPLMPLVKQLMPIFVQLLDLAMVALKPMLNIIVLLSKVIGKVLGKAFELLTPVLDIVLNAIVLITDALSNLVKGAEAAIGWLGSLLGIDLSQQSPLTNGLTSDQQSAMRAEKALDYGYGGTTSSASVAPVTAKKKSPVADAAEKALQGAIKTLEGKLDEAKKLIADVVEKFRNSVDTAFGLVQRGSGIIFRADRYIRELKRMKTATADFNSNLEKLRKMGGKAANPLLEQILSKSPEEAAAIMRSFAASPELFAEAIKTSSDLAATGGLIGAQANAMAGNQTQAEMLAEMKLLRKDLAAGKNTYNVKATMTANEIVNAIRNWEKSSGKKVLVG
jgi:hypothetical protein